MLGAETAYNAPLGMHSLKRMLLSNDNMAAELT